MSPVPPGDVVAMFDFSRGLFFFWGGGVDVMTPLLLDRRLPFFSPAPLPPPPEISVCSMRRRWLWDICLISLARSSSPIR